MQLHDTAMTSKNSLLLILTACTCLSPLYAEDEVDKEVAAATLVAKHQEAPDFTCQTTDGRSLTLSALKGKVVVLYFFSTSVKACLTEMKYLEKEVFQQLRKRDDFALIAIGRDHSREELVNVGGENKLTFPLVPDPQRAIYARYFTKFTPRTVVVAKNGTIAYLASGYREFASILDLQAVLVRELAVKAP